MKPLKQQKVPKIEPREIVTLDEWEALVFEQAVLGGKFTVWEHTKGANLNRGTVETFSDFFGAAVYSWDRPDSLLYAHAPNGRFVLCPYKKWKDLHERAKNILGIRL